MAGVEGSWYPSTARFWLQLLWGFREIYAEILYNHVSCIILYLPSLIIILNKGIVISFSV